MGQQWERGNFNREEDCTNREEERLDVRRRDTATEGEEDWAMQLGVEGLGQQGGGIEQ